MDYQTLTEMSLRSLPTRKEIFLYSFLSFKKRATWLITNLAINFLFSYAIKNVDIFFTPIPFKMTTLAGAFSAIGSLNTGQM